MGPLKRPPAKQTLISIQQAHLLPVLFEHLAGDFLRTNPVCFDGTTVVQPLNAVDSDLATKVLSGAISRDLSLGRAVRGRVSGLAGLDTTSFGGLQIVGTQTLAGILLQVGAVNIR